MGPSGSCWCSIPSLGFVAIWKVSGALSLDSRAGLDA